MSMIMVDLANILLYRLYYLVKFLMQIESKHHTVFILNVLGYLQNVIVG